MEPHDHRIYYYVNIDLRHQYGISTPESQTFLLAKRSQRRRARRNGCFRRLPMWSRFKSQFRRHMWVEFVVGSLLCPERFFSGYSRFPNSNSTRNQVDEEPHCGCATSKSLFFNLFYLFKGRLAQVALKQRPYKTHCFSSVLRYPTGLYCHKPKNLWTISQNNFPRT